MFEQLLSQTGLSPNQATIYELLLKEGGLPAGKISQKTPLKRGLVYKILEELAEKGVIAKRDQSGKVTLFSANHPEVLKDLIKKDEGNIIRAKIGIENLLPQLTSEYNLAIGKPGVRFYEGKAGVEKVSLDSLSTKGEIYSYTCPEKVDKYLDEFNRKYVKERQKRGIVKKILVADNPSNRERYKATNKELTQVKYLDSEVAPFNTVMQIYDNKISYITLNANGAIGVIIEDANIYQMHKTIFEYSWRTAKE